MTGTQLSRTSLLLCGVAALALTASALVASALTAHVATAADDENSFTWISGSDNSDDVRVLSLRDGRHEIIIEDGKVTIDGDTIDVTSGAHVLIDDGEVRITRGYNNASRHCERSIIITSDDDEEDQRVVTHGCGGHSARVLQFHGGEGVLVFNSVGELDLLEGLEALEGLGALEGLVELESLEDEVHLMIERALSAEDGEQRVVIHRANWHELSDEERREIEDAHREARDAVREARREARDAGREARHTEREARNAAREARHAEREAHMFALAERHNRNFDFGDVTRNAERIGEAVEDWPAGEYELRHEGDVTIATGPDGVERRLEGFGAFFGDGDGHLTINHDDD